jgi:lipopolysaccharide/colanic/teichoic acid biosynthesis glycosyltransferase
MSMLQSEQQIGLPYSHPIHCKECLCPSVDEPLIGDCGNEILADLGTGSNQSPSVSIVSPMEYPLRFSKPHISGSPAGARKGGYPKGDLAHALWISIRNRAILFPSCTVVTLSAMTGHSLSRRYVRYNLYHFGFRRVSAAMQRLRPRSGFAYTLGFTLGAAAIAQFRKSGPKEVIFMVSNKRMFDISISVVAFILLLPAFVLSAIAILLEDGAPVFFKQKRIGRDGKLFDVLKFRKLRHSPGEATPLIVTCDDERYTLVGRILERTKLNEIPQLINVMKGDMSLVGPRPEIPQFLHCYGGPLQDLLSIKPGIFGPSQAAYRNESDLYPAGVDKTLFYESVLFRRKAEIDLSYYPTANVGSDAYWIFRSLCAVLFPNGLYRPSTAGAGS